MRTIASFVLVAALVAGCAEGRQGERQLDTDTVATTLPRVQQSDPRSLFRGRWYLVGAVHPPTYVDFRHGTISGIDNCNSISARWSRDGGDIRFSGETSTLVGCDDADLLGRLKATRRWESDGERLILLSASGEVVAQFSRGTERSRYIG